MTKAMLLAAALALASNPGVVPAAQQNDYPSRPVRLVVTFPPGSGADIMARIIGQKLTESFGQQIVVDNRAGAGDIGVGSHLAGELLKTMTGIDIVNVPYKGAPPATADVVAGQVQMTFSTMPTGLPLVKAGKLRVLGVTSAERVPATPDIPTVAESGVPGFDLRTWQAMLAPGATPRPVIARVHGEVVRALQLPDVRERLTAQGHQPVGNTPEQFAAVIKSEIAKWAKVVKAAGIKPLAPAGR